MDQSSSFQYYQALLKHSTANARRLTFSDSANISNLDVAHAFNQTSRTLQRRLEEEGTSFRQLTEGLKRRICELLIRHNRYSVADAAFLLGYSDAAAFIHSFTKWYGQPPNKMRAKLG